MKAALGGQSDIEFCLRGYVWQLGKWVFFVGGRWGFQIQSYAAAGLGHIFLETLATFNVCLTRV
jgi:hypothetical protein